MSRYAITVVAGCANPLTVVPVRRFQAALEGEQLLDRIQTELDPRKRTRMCVACHGHGMSPFEAAVQALLAMDAAGRDTWGDDMVRQLEVTVLGAMR
jgi:hypothetical protein